MFLIKMHETSRNSDEPIFDLNLASAIPLEALPVPLLPQV